MQLVKIDNGLFLPIVEPVIAGNPAVVFVDLAVALPPVVELATGDGKPSDELSSADVGFFRPALDEIDDPVPGVMRDPNAV
jgi:hypothetical protein